MTVARKLLLALAAAVGVLVAGAVGLLLVARLGHERPVDLPAPTGAFAVGRLSYHWVEPASADATPAGDRTLAAWVWYPAEVAPGQAPADYLPAPWRRAFEARTSPLLGHWLTQDLAHVRAHAVAGAALSPAMPRYPVVLLRAGGAALTLDYTALAEDLASHGYVVLGVDAPGLSTIVVAPDGTVRDRLARNDLDGSPDARLEARAARLTSAWVAHLRFSLDQLARLAAPGAGAPWSGRLDLARVAAVGHSLGGAAALQFCHDDARCQAAVDIDGAPFGSVVAQGMTKPCLVLSSDHGADTDAFSRRAAADLRTLLLHVPPDRRLQLEMRGTNHFGFADAMLVRSPAILAVLTRTGLVRVTGPQQIAATRHCLQVFLDRALRGRADGPPIVPDRAFPWLMRVPVDGPRTGPVSRRP